jgi:hypothetical protein
MPTFTYLCTLIDKTLIHRKICGFTKNSTYAQPMPLPMPSRLILTVRTRQQQKMGYREIL